MSNLPRPTDRHLTANGMTFHYLEWGPSEAPPLVLLHGGRQEAHVWDLVAAALADRFHVYALDQRGHGDTGPAPDGRYDHGAYAADLGAVLNGLGLERPAVIGHSLGAHVATRYESEHPGRFDRLVIVDVAPDRSPERLANPRPAKHWPTRFRHREEFLAHAQVALPWRHHARHLDVWRWTYRQEPDGTWVDKAAGGFHGNPSDEYTNPARFAQRWQELARVTCPTLIVRGGRSKVLPVEAAEKMLTVLANARLVTIPGTGHNPHFDTADAFLAAARPFLRA
jgi:pimeloyl-ACP methyl ester carboxylesterase